MTYMDSLLRDREFYKIQLIFKYENICSKIAVSSLQPVVKLRIRKKREQVNPTQSRKILRIYPRPLRSDFCLLGHQKEGTGRYYFWGNSWRLRNRGKEPRKFQKVRVLQKEKSIKIQMYQHFPAQRGVQLLKKIHFTVPKEEPPEQRDLGSHQYPIPLIYIHIMLLGNRSHFKITENIHIKLIQGGKKFKSKHLS